MDINEWTPDNHAEFIVEEGGSDYTWQDETDHDDTHTLYGYGW